MKIKVKQIKQMKKQLKGIQELIKAKNFCAGVSCYNCPINIGFSRKNICDKSKIFDAVEKALSKLNKIGGLKK